MVTIKVCVLQAKYSFDEKEADKCFEGLMELLEKAEISVIE